MAEGGAPVACVTGVSRGLGAALGADLLGRGWEVVGIGRSADAALAGPRFRLVEADLADASALDRIATAAFDGLASRAPSRAVLINNAAVAGPIGPLGALAGDEIARSLAVNLVAPMILANAFVRSLRGRVRGRVINVSSGLAVHPLAGVAAYCAAKAGIEMVTAVAASEAASGIAAATVRPGVIDTPMQAYLRSQPVAALPAVDMFEGFRAEGKLQAPAETARRIVERLVLGDFANGAVLGYHEL